MTQDFVQASEPCYTYYQRGAQKKIEPTLRRGRRLSIIGLFQPLVSFVYGLVIGGVERKSYIQMMEKEAEESATLGRIRVIVQDNCPIHRCLEVQQLWSKWESQGLYIFFLPKYCSEMNPIELEWQHIKKNELAGAKFADGHDFAAVWIPERHFHSFGGIYPNPSVLGAALAMVTERVRLRAGSVVLPLQNPIRVAEEWSVVDNLSKGRVDLAFARGWNPNDFVLSPETYANRTEALFSGMQTVQNLWRGEANSLPNGIGKETEIKVYPLPKQRELSVWMACSGGKERFIEAGALGVNILTALLFQPIEELAEKIALYRDSRAKHGHDPEAGHVTLMLHTFVGEDIEIVRNQVRKPFTEYLKSSVDLWRQDSKNLDDLTEKEREDLLAYAFERYFQTSALFGTPDTCLARVGRLKESGVNEIACLIDFGVDVDAVMEALYSLTRLKEHSNVDVNSVASEENQPQGGVIISNKIDLENPEQLLAQLQQISEQEVDSLLSKLLINNPR